MATINYGDGDKEFRCTAWTQVIYEHEFCNDKNSNVTGDIIGDVMWKYRVSSKDIEITPEGELITTIDYTRENRPAQMRALWAMLKTAEEIAVEDGKECEPVPSYEEWTKSLLKCEADWGEVSMQIGQELQRGLFRSGAAASEKTSKFKA